MLPEDSLTPDDQIDERCDAFESAWRTGQRPSLRSFISPAENLPQQKLFCELLFVELERRRELGEQPTRQEYLNEFPEFAEQIVSAGLRYGVDGLEASSDEGGGRELATGIAPGALLDHFQLVERLGEGAMGQAWKAWDMRLRRPVTIKLPHSSNLSEGDRRRFLRESEATAQLSHPQLSSIYEVRPRGGSFYIVAKYVEGQELREFAKSRNLTPVLLAQLCARIASALQHAHDEGVIHRDLKPANIIVDANGIPHIIDFGLAKLAGSGSDLTISGELLGTPAYMPPELASGRGLEADARSDVYSLGVVLYELLAGRCPFEGSRGDVISKILACQPTPPRKFNSSIPKNLQTICLKAIEKNPADRYASSQDFADDLERFAAGQTIRARRASWVEQCWRWTRRHPAIAASILLVLGAAAVSTAKITSLNNENRRLEGYRPVRISTSPSGARVALVRIDTSTNEPSSNPTDVIRLQKTTPLVENLKPGKYLVEAVLSGSDGQPGDFVEVYRTVAESTVVSAPMRALNIDSGIDPDAQRIANITIKPQKELFHEMVAVPVDEDLRRDNPLLPGTLYVDPVQTNPVNGGMADDTLRATSDGPDSAARTVNYRSALAWAEAGQKRLPSAAEYDAIVRAVERGTAVSVRTGMPAEIGDLFDDYPEFSTTIKSTSGVAGHAVEKHLRDMRILKGYKDVSKFPELITWLDGDLLVGPQIESDKIRSRGVRSATPRFVKP